jgi:phosphate transport system substrate-binding protein
MTINKPFSVKKITVGLTLIGLLATVGCAGNQTGEKSTGEKTTEQSGGSGGGTITSDGSSTVEPLTAAVAEEFSKSKGGKVQVTVAKSGTGGGFKKFCRGELDISNASRPILEKEVAACKEAKVEYIELPIAYDALTVVVSPTNTWVKDLKVSELKTMWEGAAKDKIKTWDQIRPGFPKEKLTLFGAGTDSGTFDYFVEAIVKKKGDSRSDYTPSEDDNVTINGVSKDKTALGYLGFSYYEANKDKLKAVAIDDGKGPVLPSIATVNDGTYTPLSRPLFIYVNKKSADKPEVKEFVEYYLKNAEKLAKESGYVPLPTSAYTTVAGYFANKRTGSVFGGKEEVGLKIDDILKREPK